MRVATITICVLLTTTVMSHPTKKEKKVIDELENRISIPTIEAIFDKLENMLVDNIGNLYSKINSLTITSENLLQLISKNDAAISNGQLNDMTHRCPKGFQAVAGDRMCYYLSTYKLPWHQAREHCLQLGKDVEPLSIRTTKMQFSVTHLIQSDPEAQQVRRWWTAGHGTGADWVWTMRERYESFFFKYWANDPKISEISPDADSCVVLDSEFFYQWKKVPCPRITRRSQATTVDGEDAAMHHFICQVEPTPSENIDQGLLREAQDMVSELKFTSTSTIPTESTPSNSRL